MVFNSDDTKYIIGNKSYTNRFCLTIILLNTLIHTNKAIQDTTLLDNCAII